MQAQESLTQYSFEDMHQSLDDYKSPGLPKKKGRKKRSELEASGVFVPVHQRSTKGVYREGPHKTLGGRENPLIIYKNIEGMCVLLKKPLCDTDLKDLDEKNFFPYVDKHHMEYGFMFQEPDGTYRNLPQQKWSAILHGKTHQFRPLPKTTGVLPDNNRVSVKDGIAGEVTICYWPDKYYERHKKTHPYQKRASQSEKDPNSGAPTKRSNIVLTTQSTNTFPVTMSREHGSSNIDGTRHRHHIIAAYLLGNSSFVGDYFANAQ